MNTSDPVTSAIDVTIDGLGYLLKKTTMLRVAAKTELKFRSRSNGSG